MAPVNSSAVVVYGSKDCGRCTEVKDALKANGIMFSEEDSKYLNDSEYNPNWRTNGSVDLLAEVSFFGWNGDLPLIKVAGSDVILAADKDEITIDGHVIPVAQKAHCTDGSCNINFSKGAAATKERALAVA